MKNLKIKLNMKRLNYLFIVLFFVLTVVGTFFVVKNKFGKKDILDELININELDDKFMDKYYKDSADLLDNGNRDNVLIVVSKNKLKDVYGAKRVVNAPNNTFILEYENEEYKKTAMKKFKADKDIYNVIENRIYKFTDEPENDNNQNEKSYNSWGIEKSGLAHAIDIVNEKGAERVNAAIIDSGCDMDLFNQSYEGKIEEVYNLYETSTYGNDVMFDHVGHGTHIAGTIAEGTSDNVKIIPFKVSDDSQLDSAAILYAINYITSNHAADVINMSFGTQFTEEMEMEFDVYTDPEYIAIEAAKNENIICVAAAGNDNTSLMHIPSFFDNTISISAVDQNLDKAEFSNYSDTVDFAAPGVDILSINGVYSGTSMATPHAVSAIALIKSFKKDISLQDTKDVLKNYSDDLGAKGKDSFFGYGFINLTNLKECDENSTESCTEFGTNDKIEPTHIEVDEVVLTPYNYGSLTNILPTRIKLLDSNDKYEIVTLDKLDDLTISGYDPYASGEQTVNISYLDMESSFKVTNPVDYEIGWVYQKHIDDNLTETDDYEICGYKDNNLKLEKIFFPSKINNIDVVAVEFRWPNQQIFSNSNDALYYREVYLPESIRVIGYGLSNLKRLNLIKSDAEELLVRNLSSLSYLTTVDANVILNNDSHNTFSGDISLQNIKLSSKTTIIPSSSFRNCSFLENLDIPESVTEIGDSAFRDSMLSDVILPEKLKTIGVSAFDGTRIESVYIPKSVTTIGENAFNAKYLKHVEVDEENLAYDSRNDSNCIIESGTNTLIIGSRNTVIPSDVKRIDNYAFSFSPMKEIEIPDGVASIGKYAFSECVGLEKIKIPSSVKLIEEHAFDYAGFYAFGTGTVFFVKDSSYSKNYAIDNDFSYVLYDKTPNVPIIEEGRFGDGKYEYLPFEQADTSENTFIIKYKDIEEEEVIDTFTKVKYFDAEDGFRYDDLYYIAFFDSKYGYYNMHVKWPVQVGKKTPEYEIPTVVYANLGSRLDDVDLPSGFEWEDGSIELDEVGEKIFDARYVPEDDYNYSIVEDIAISVTVIDKTLVKPTISVTDKEYDGTTNLSEENVSITGIDSEDYTVESLVVNNSNAGNRKALIKLRLSDDKYESYSFSNGKQEKIFEIDIKITPERVQRPTVVDTKYVYNSQYQVLQLNNYNNKKMNIKNNRQIDAGTYDVEVSLKNKNYVWSDGLSDYSIYTFKIEKATIVFHGIDNEFMFDGNEHWLEFYPSIPNCNFKFMDDHGNYTLDESPKYSEPGVYVIKYMITAGDNYKVAYGENTLTIIQDDTFVIKDNNIIIGVSDFDTVVSRLPSNFSPSDYSHYDKNEDLVTYDSMKTGDIIKNSNNTVEYHVVVLGDTSGDGKVNYLDYVNIYNHIQKDKHPLSNKNKLQDVYYEAGDFNRDGSISYLDYVQLFKKISDNKGGETE